MNKKEIVIKLYFLLVFIMIVLGFIIQSDFSFDDSSENNFGLFNLKSESIEFKPQGNFVTDFYLKEKNFSVEGKFDSIMWYFDNKLILQNYYLLSLKNISVGNHSVKVIVTKESKQIEKDWNYIVVDDVVIIEKANPGKVIFYSTIIIITIIIGLIISLLILESNSKKNSVQSGFGISGFKRNSEIANYLNILE